MAEIYRNFSITIENGRVIIRNPYGFTVCSYAGRSIEFARKMVDDMLEPAGKSR